MRKGIRFQAIVLHFLVFAAALSGAQNASSPEPGSFRRLDFAFALPSDFGSGTQGFASAASLSYRVRKGGGSYGFSLRFLSAPASMKDMPFGNFGSARLGYAAVLSPGISVGAGISGTFGDNPGLGWNLAADLGLEGFSGDLGFLKEFAWGISLSGLGVSGGIPLPAWGMHRSMPEIGIDPWPSAKVGVHALLLRRENLRLGLGLGLVSPGFEDIGFFSSLDLAFGENFGLKAGWDIGWKDLATGTIRSLLPSFGVSAFFPLDGIVRGIPREESVAEAEGSAERDQASGISVAAGFEPLYGAVSAASGALSLSWASPVTIVAKNAGRISPLFISPNGDGIQDSLAIPLELSSAGNVGAFHFRIRERATGRVVYEDSLVRNEPDSMQRMRADGDTLALVHAGIEAPRILVWDGRLADGGLVPEGEYIAGYVYRAIGGSWRLGQRDLIPLTVDRSPPAMKLAFGGEKVFSPDGDGRKDGLSFLITGTQEASWKLEILDAAGKIAFSREWTDAKPSDFQWSGKDAQGDALPDGVYSLRLTGKDAAGNSATGTLEGIAIDTRSPKARLSVDLSAFSPNGDGRKDRLGILPWLESYEQLSGFSIVVLDASGASVWSTQDRGSLDAGIPFSFDGMSVGGRPLPDGEYRATMDLEYVNGHRLTTDSPFFRIDTRPPVASLSLPEANPVFSPDGDGRQDSLALSIAASGGKDWTLRVVDASGSGVASKSYRESPPASYFWDGRTDAGAVAPEGEYRFELAGSDDAGNFAIVASPGFFLDLARPSAQILCDAEVFSPDGDGILETIALTPRIQSRAVPASWTLTVRNASGIAVRRMESEKSDALPDKFLLDGKDPATRKVWSDGRYQATLSCFLRNGYSVEASSPWFRLDTTPPEASIQADRQVINPAATGAASRVRIAQTGTSSDSWKGELSGPEDSPARSWDFDSRLPAVLEWEGRDSSGRRLPDGVYSYRLRGADDAGHSFVSRPVQILVDTETKSVTLAVEPAIFSPDGDGKSDTANFGIATTSRMKPSSYALEIFLRSPQPASAKGATKPARVRGFSGRGDVPRSISWDGLADSGSKAQNGTYSATVAIAYPNGDRCESAAVEFSLDTNKPKVFVKADASSLSPNDDGFMDELGFTLIVDRNSAIASWNFSIVSADRSAKIFLTRSGGDIPGRLVWDGRDETGNPVHGQVFGRLAVLYAKGDIAEASSETVIAEEPLARLEIVVLPDFFSPDGDGVKDMATFLVTVDEPSQVASWRLDILESAAGEGLADSREARERIFQTWSGSGAPPVSITWDGRSQAGEKVQAASDYPFRMSVKDRKGNQVLVNGIIVVDVLVVREGSRIRINIPSIEFRASLGDFSGLSPQSEAKNQKVISRLVQILSRFPDFRIRIEGHANNEAKIAGLSADRIEAEEKGETVPLSLARASFIRDMLVSRGFDARRFSVAGIGSSLPAVEPKDPVSRWKNRRVEFILVREP